ncbi:MAG TPA: CPBP family intramembrane glutamic endopeptidase [Agriterribacter sp.]|nr:CPBP family intramembrane glutamic endopeptidase [Agriterribacter sp.]
MYDADSKGVSYNNAFLILIGLWIGGFIAGAVLSIVVWGLMSDKSLLSMPTELLKPENLNVVRVIQIVSTAVTFFLPAYLTALIINRKPSKFLGFNTRFNYRQLLLALGIMFAAAITAAALAELNELIPIPQAASDYFRKLEDSYGAQVEAITNIKTFGDYIISVFVIALLPAVFEETFFRGGMQNLLTRISKKPWVSILITSLIFSFIHLSYYGFMARVCLGVVLGLIYYFSRSLWLGIAAHFFNNAIAVTQMYIMIRQGKSVKEAMNETYPMWWGIIGVIILYVLFMLFKKISKEARIKYTSPEDRALEEKWIA